MDSGGLSMARGVNKAILIGNLGQDPEVRYTPSGAAVCNVPLATTESWKDRESGERREKTEWHRLVFFGRLAEITAEYMRKGSQTYVEGRLQTRKWQDQSGNDRYTTEVIVSEMHILGNRNGGANTARYDNQNPSAGRPESRSAPPRAKPGSEAADGATGGAAGGAGSGKWSGSGNNDFDDDIPF